MDVAAVLVSMYATVTVILAWIVLKEKITRLQWIGVGLCSMAIALISI